ncbi:MAG: Flp family type IVb pilin [Planctomycetaceae bacterium]|nr:Flp family type IVb pilin [Planctomycetaceae bacterium]
MQPKVVLARIANSHLMRQLQVACSQRRLAHWFRDEKGSTAVEYALILGLICSVLLTSVRTLGNSSIATFSKVSDALGSASEYATMESSIEAPVAISVPAPIKK